MGGELFLVNDGLSVTQCFLRHAYVVISFNRDLSDNQFSGGIPKEIYNLANLTRLLVDDGF